MPARATREPRAVNAADVSATGSPFREREAGKPSPCSRETKPPSWSTAMSGGRPGSTVSAAVSACNSASVAGILAPMRMNPPSPDSMYDRRADGSVPATCPMTTVAACSATVISCTRAFARAVSSSDPLVDTVDSGMPDVEGAPTADAVAADETKSPITAASASALAVRPRRRFSMSREVACLSRTAPRRSAPPSRRRRSRSGWSGRPCTVRAGTQRSRQRRRHARQLHDRPDRAGSDRWDRRR